MSGARRCQIVAPAQAEETVGLLEEGEAELWEVGAPVARSAAGPQRIKKLVYLSLGVAALFAIATARRAAAPQEADVGSSVGLIGGLELATALADGVTMAAKLVKDTQTSKQDIQDTWSDFQKPTEEIQKQVLAERPPKNVTEGLKHLRGDALFKKLDEDGKLCPDDEEEHAGLCYGKCSDITNGEYSIRTTAFSCCMQRPCSIFNTKFSSMFKFCMGNDVAGQREGGGCPHRPGDCLKNEELLLGECYMQCAILTDNQFTFRIGPQTCCKYQTKMACLDPLNTMSAANFSVGGGANDPTYNITFGEAHAPLPDLAQVLATSTMPAPPPLPEMPTLAPPKLSWMPTIPPLPVMAPLAPLPEMPPLPGTPSMPDPNECEAQTDKEKCSDHKPSDGACFCSWFGASCAMACA